MVMVITRDTRDTIDPLDLRGLIHVKLQPIEGSEITSMKL